MRRWAFNLEQDASQGCARLEPLTAHVHTDFLPGRLFINKHQPHHWALSSSSFSSCHKTDLSSAADEVISFKKRRKGEGGGKKAGLERVFVKSRACGKQWRGASISRARAPDNVIIRWWEPERALKTDEEFCRVSPEGKREQKKNPRKKGERSSERPVPPGRSNTASSQPPGRRPLFRLTRWQIISSPP